ncbi:polycystin-2-like [Scaptodrosophila lebanonensis]|uniref:Polycystin-2-like n=1 Tax=Drosophila lebanonensis TaxID=7225 RepID=A0A6J2UKA9_DROLE|nr:polycystin-2-like [Scaptodrosophila lebanonensis]
MSSYRHQPPNYGHIRYTSEVETHNALRQMAIFVVYLICVTVVCNAASEKSVFYSNSRMMHLFGRKVFIKPNQPMQFSDITTIVDFWYFVELVALPLFHGRNFTEEYGNYTDERIEGMELNQTFLVNTAPTLRGSRFLNENIMLGPPRLRQIRVRSDSCLMNYAFIRYFNNCYASYSPFDELTDPEYKGTKFYQASALGITTLTGSVHTYSSAGYVQNLTYDKEENYRIVRELKKINWLDRGSRLAVLEFNTYNMNMRKFQIVKFIAEILPTGLVNPNMYFKTVHEDPLEAKGTSSSWVFYCAIGMFVINLYYTYADIKKYILIGNYHFIRNITNYVDVTRTMIVYAFLVYCIYHYREISYLAKKISSTTEFIPLDNLSYWHIINRYNLAILVCLSWICILKFMDFNPVLKKLGHAISDAATDLAAFFIMFAIVSIAYGVLGLLLFGTKNINFKDFNWSVLTTVRILVADFSYFQLEQKFPILGPLYFISYVMIMFFILLNMFLAVIVLAYRTSQSTMVFKPSFLCYVLKKHLFRLSRGIFKPPAYPSWKQNKSHGAALTPEKLRDLRKQKELEDIDEDLDTLYARLDMIDQVLYDLTKNMDNIVRAAEKGGKKKK